MAVAVKWAVYWAPIASVTGATKNETWPRERHRSSMRRNRIAVEQREPTNATTLNNFRRAITAELRTTCEIVEQIQTVDFPDCRSPITSSRWPFATGKSTSTTRSPVTTEGVFRERTKMEGEALSTMINLLMNVYSNSISKIYHCGNVNLELNQKVN
jgi:hypothetical protein